MMGKLDHWLRGVNRRANPESHTTGKVLPGMPKDYNCRAQCLVRTDVKVLLKVVEAFGEYTEDHGGYCRMGDDTRTGPQGCTCGYDKLQTKLNALVSQEE